eukprot:CAMPEP_0116895102 /NCGR_PEP_ID=MMETSP0467-20121206/4719_1 /TAXON_ID=283647 /ORGANISM="Mesodinium pulex, Strain SPMC105" /LENGTH=115 /DNA_ID=CAMNT_0004565683 /DNA_START=1127 /DNA_END=1474 /DNA_ORIENTATION=+
MEENGITVGAGTETVTGSGEQHEKEKNSPIDNNKDTDKMEIEDGKTGLEKGIVNISVEETDKKELNSKINADSKFLDNRYLDSQITINQYDIGPIDNVDKESNYDNAHAHDVDSK